MWLVGTVGSRKLTRSVILKYNLVQLCETIKMPKVPLALPTQSTLLRGVVRIEEKQTHFLFTDAIEARARLLAANQQAAAEVDLPSGSRASVEESITTEPLHPNQSLAGVDTVPSRSMNLSLNLDAADYTTGDIPVIPGADLTVLGGLGGLDNLANLTGFDSLTNDTSLTSKLLANRGSSLFPEMDTGMAIDTLELNDISLDDVQLAEAGSDYTTAFDAGFSYDDLSLTRRSTAQSGATAANSAGAGEDTAYESIGIDKISSDDVSSGFDAESAVLELTASAQASGTAATRKRRRLDTVNIDDATELSDEIMAYQLGNVSVCTAPRPIMKRVKLLGPVLGNVNSMDIQTALSIPLPLATGLLPHQLPLTVREAVTDILNTAAANPNISTIGVTDRATAAAAGLTHILQDHPGLLNASTGFFEDVQNLQTGADAVNPDDQSFHDQWNTSTYDEVELGRGGAARAADSISSDDLGVLAYYYGKPVDLNESLPSVQVPSSFSQVGTIEHVSGSQVQVPDLNDLAQLSQFELPVEEVATGESQTAHRLKPAAADIAFPDQEPGHHEDGTMEPRVRSLAELGRVARVFYRIVDDAIKAAVPRVSEIEERKVKPSEVQVSFADALQHAAEMNRSKLPNGSRKPVRLTARDVALSFVNLLALRCDDVIDTQQDGPYMPIYISHGRNWHLREE